MDQIGVFTPEQARELWQWYQSQKQLAPQLTKNFPQRRPLDEVSPHRAFVKNTEAEAIPPYGCMRVTGTEQYLDRTVITVEKPTLLTGEFLFNSPYEIESGAAGWAYRFGVVVMLGNNAESGVDIEAGTLYQPIVGSWEIEEGGGPFVVFGRHDASDKALIGRFTGGGDVELSHGVILEVCNAGCSTYRVQRIHRYLTPTCDEESGIAS